MKKSLPATALVLCASALLLPACAHAQGEPVVLLESPLTQKSVVYSQQELDAMLAPIALYPDALLAQLLMAATYPIEVVEAARWTRSGAIQGLSPQQAVAAAASRNWEPSVQSMVAFPQLLSLMDEQLEWTQRLGNAMLAQQAQVWATVQNLRQRAYEAGQLRSSEQVRVLHNGPVIVLEPARPEIVYVPYYDPHLVYGPWWWPGYAPVRWAPWPGYVLHRGWAYPPGPGVYLGLGFFFGYINWPSYRVVLAPPERRPHYYPRPIEYHPEWRHDPRHRRNVPYPVPPVHIQPTPAVPAPVVPAPRSDVRVKVPTRVATPEALNFAPASRPAQQTLPTPQQRLAPPAESPSSAPSRVRALPVPQATNPTLNPPQPISQSRQTYKSGPAGNTPSTNRPVVTNPVMRTTAPTSESTAAPISLQKGTPERTQQHNSQRGEAQQRQTEAQRPSVREFKRGGQDERDKP